RGRLIHRPLAELLRLDELVVPAELDARLRRLPRLLASREVDALVVRGPQHNGRKTLLGAVAAELGRGLLQVPRRAPRREAGRPPQPSEDPPDEAWRLVGPLATLLNAMPVVTCELAPGETIELPRLAAYDGPLGVVMGPQGGLRDAGQVLTLAVEMPSTEE